MRVTILLVAAALLLSPAAMGAFSTRGVHDDVWNTFTPEPADIPAQKKDVNINCGEGATTSIMGGENFLPGSKGAQKHLPCWDGGNHLHSADGEEDGSGQNVHDLWTDADGIVGATPPAYTCTATKDVTADGEPVPYDLDVKIQNPFAIQHTGPEAGQSSDGGPASQGVILATGSFYVVPELSGADASEVDAIWFGFLETTPTVPEAGIGGGSDELCPELLHEGQAAAGAYYEYYRGDIDKSDGWTIPINSLLVPDNTYGAYLKFYADVDEVDEALDDGDNNDGVGLDEFGHAQPVTDGQPSPGGLKLIGMGFNYATTDNFHDDSSIGGDRGVGCTPQRLACVYQDTTPPWPQVTPGDTDLPLSWIGDKASDEKLQVTFGEEVQFPNTATSFFLNGNPISPVSAKDDVSDVDSVPLFTLPETGTDEWGPNFVFDVNLEPCDNLEINAIDTHGNTAKKTLTIEDPRAGQSCSTA